MTFPKEASYFYFNYKSSFSITVDGSEITLSDASGQNQGEQGGQSPPSDQGGPGDREGSSDQGGPGGQSPPSD